MFLTKTLEIGPFFVFVSEKYFSANYLAVCLRELQTNVCKLESRNFTLENKTERNGPEVGSDLYKDTDNRGSYKREKLEVTPGTDEISRGQIEK